MQGNKEIVMLSLFVVELLMIRFPGVFGLVKLVAEYSRDLPWWRLTQHRLTEEFLDEDITDEEYTFLLDTVYDEDIVGQAETFTEFMSLVIQRVPTKYLAEWLLDITLGGPRGSILLYLSLRRQQKLWLQIRQREAYQRVAYRNHRYFYELIRQVLHPFYVEVQKTNSLFLSDDQIETLQKRIIQHFAQEIVKPECATWFQKQGLVCIDTMDIMRQRLRHGMNI